MAAPNGPRAFAQPKRTLHMSGQGRIVRHHDEVHPAGRRRSLSIEALLLERGITDARIVYRRIQVAMNATAKRQQQLHPAAYVRLAVTAWVVREVQDGFESVLTCARVGATTPPMNTSHARRSVKAAGA